MIFIEPNAGPAPIVQVIEQAHTSLDVNVYELTDRRVLDALRQAVARGVPVRILLAPHPWATSARTVAREWANARATGAVVQAAPSRFQFDHAKYLCSAHQCAVGTANFTYAGLDRNREYIEVTRQAPVVGALTTLFQADWTGVYAGQAPRNWLVVAPGATPGIVALLRQPGTVCVETEEMGDDPSVMAAMAAKGGNLHLLLPSRISRSQIGNVRRLVADGVNVRLMAGSTYLHAKAIAGPQWVFIGSENFTTTSLQRNREAGVTISGADAAAVTAQCQTDWQNGQAVGAG